MGKTVYDRFITLRVTPKDFRSTASEGLGAPWSLSFGETTSLAPSPLGRGQVRRCCQTFRFAMRSRLTVPSQAHLARRRSPSQAIVLGTRSPRDPRTLAAWGQAVGISRGALRAWCGAAGVSARSCLDFLRVLRAVTLSRALGWELLSVLDVVDRRSLGPLLKRGGVQKLLQGEQPTAMEFMAAQQYLKNEPLLHAINRLLQVAATISR